jgi:hypothetical protein
MPSPAPAVITITADGFQPASLTVAVGARVTFVNEDVLPHDVRGGRWDADSHECPEIDAVGFLAPGQRRQTDPLPGPRECDYHQQHHTPRYSGRILTQ